MNTTIRHLFTAAEAERWLGIPAATIRSWARRRRIWSYGLDSHGHPMYDLEHLLNRRNVDQTGET